MALFVKRSLLNKEHTTQNTVQPLASSVRCYLFRTSQRVTVVRFLEVFQGTTLQGKEF